MKKKEINIELNKIIFNFSLILAEFALIGFISIIPFIGGYFVINCLNNVHPSRFCESSLSTENPQILRGQQTSEDRSAGVNNSIGSVIRINHSVIASSSYRRKEDTTLGTISESCSAFNSQAKGQVNKILIVFDIDRSIAISCVCGCATI